MGVNWTIGKTEQAGLGGGGLENFVRGCMTVTEPALDSQVLSSWSLYFVLPHAFLFLLIIQKGLKEKVEDGQSRDSSGL